MTTELPPEAKPTDPNGRLVDIPRFTVNGEFPPAPEGYEYTGILRYVYEVRPIPEPTVMVELTVADAEWWGCDTNPINSLRGRLGVACRAALEREGLT